jgi:hypothetical protein
MDISNIVSVTVSRETQTVSQTGFGVINILGPNVNLSTRLTRYSSLSSLATVLHGGVLAPEYLAAQAIFSQSPKVSEIALTGQVGTKTITDSAGTYTAGSIVVTVNGTVITQTYDTDKNTTLTALAAAIAALSTVASAVYNSGVHTIVITPETGVLLSISVTLTGITGTMTMTITATATESAIDALTAVRLYDDDWYGLIATTRDATTQGLIAAWTEANSKVFACASANANIVNVAPLSDTTSLAAVLKAAAYDRTICMYDALAATTYPEAAVLGKVFPLHPGSYALMFKTLVGVTRSLLSETQSYNARQKNCLVYETIGGVNILQEGKMASGEYFDVIVFIDWLVARIKEAAFANFVKQGKVSFDEDGILSCRNAIEPPFEEGLSYSGISPFAYDSDGVQIGGYFFTVPKLADISAIDKAARTLNGLKATAFLAGAIQKMTLDLTITY